MSFPDLVIVKDQHVSGNETSPGCFSAAEGGRGGEAASFDLFLTPAGRPRFFGEVLRSRRRSFVGENHICIESVYNNQLLYA